MALAMYYYYFIDEKVYLFRLEDIPESVFLQPIIYYLLAINSMLIGFIIYYTFQESASKKLFSTTIELRQIIQKHSSLLNVSAVIPVTLLFIAVVGLFFIYGDGFWERSYYLEENVRWLQTFLKLEGFAFVVMNALMYKKHPILSRVQVFLFLFFSITTGSRKLFVLYLFHVFITYMLGKKTTWSKCSFLLSIIFSFILLSYVMTLRSLPSHGLIPYLSNIDLAIGDIDKNLLFVAYYISAFSYFVTANVLEVYQGIFSWENMWIAVNPMLGTWAGWYNISDSMRLNVFAPYNSYGEVFSAGYIFTFVFYTFIGIIYAFFEKNIRKYYKEGNITGAISIFILVVFSLLVAQQYNLRTTMRFIYYALALIGALYCFKLFFKRQK